MFLSLKSAIAIGRYNFYFESFIIPMHTHRELLFTDIKRLSKKQIDGRREDSDKKNQDHRSENVDNALVNINLIFSCTYFIITWNIAG